MTDETGSAPLVMRKDGLEPVLMLVPFFAPQSHAAMFRAHKLAKYLPQHGYRPIVVTTGTNYIYNDVPALLDELPDCVEVHRAPYIEPTLRGIRMALGGPDRTFAAMKAATTTAAPGVPEGRLAQRAVRSGKFGSVIARIIGDQPDRHWTWTGPAFGMADRLIREHDIRLMYTSANPVSFLRAALRLKRRHVITWIADNRDPIGYGRKHSSPAILAHLQERQIIRKSMAIADHVTGLSQSYGQIFYDLYGVEETRFSFIPTGLDADYLGDVPTPQSGRYLLHVGEVMQDQSGYFYDVLQAAQARDPQAWGAMRLVFVGRREINEPLIRAQLARLPQVLARVEFIDHVPQAEVYALIRGAAACLLLPGPLRYWWTNFAKMVDYIALGAPVIADVPPISEARNELGKTGKAFFLDGEVTADAAALNAWLPHCRDLPRLAYADRYLARQQVAEFAQLLDRRLSARVGRN